MVERCEVERRLKQFLFDECGIDVAESRDGSVPHLLSDGFMDSLGVLKLVCFIESEFGILLHPDQLHPDEMDTIPQIVELIARVWE